MTTPQMSSLASSQGPRVLVVEDDPDLRQLVADVLADAGYDVQTMDNGRDVLVRLGSRKERPALLLLDLMMPDVSGWDVLEALQGQRRPAPAIVVLSAVPDAAMPLPHVRWVRKPFDAESLLAAVKAALDGRPRTRRDGD
jgi:DNA-binding response OmpR family regulator